MRDQKLYESSTLKATVPEAMRSYILKKRNDVVVFIRNIIYSLRMP